MNLLTYFFRIPLKKYETKLITRLFENFEFLREFEKIIPKEKFFCLKSWSSLI